MLYYSFKNYEDFKRIFGIIEHGNGQKSRRNKILLSVLKQKELLHDVVTHKSNIANDLLRCRDIGQLFMRLSWALAVCPDWYGHRIVLLDKVMFSQDYKLDDMKGICEDGDFTSVRYVSMNGRVYKMRIGKFIRKIILESKYYKYWSEQAILWYCEEFSRNWEVYASQTMPKMKLVVDDDFERIYDRGCLRGDFHSCMVDEDIEEFYKHCVSARAASLRDEDNMILARCVIFDEVFDEDNDKVYRLAERQYAKEENELLKRVLVNKLISAGEIDGYKRVGADCHSPNAFILNDGTPINHDMHISCKIEDRSTFIPYMDSFKYYDEHNEICRNYEGYEDYVFEETSGHPFGQNYDEYHDRYTEDEVRIVYYHGREVTCSVCDMDDFRYVQSQCDYYHEDDVIYCENCGEYELKDDGYYSDITDEWYCSKRCLDLAEEEYKEVYWVYSGLLGEYFETEDELIEAEEDWYRDNDYLYSYVTEEWYKTQEELEKAEEEFNKD